PSDEILLEEGQAARRTACHQAQGHHALLGVRLVPGARPLQAIVLADIERELAEVRRAEHPARDGVIHRLQIGMTDLEAEALIAAGHRVEVEIAGVVDQRAADRVDRPVLKDVPVDADKPRQIVGAHVLPAQADGGAIGLMEGTAYRHDAAGALLEVARVRVGGTGHGRLVEQVRGETVHGFIEKLDRERGISLIQPGFREAEFDAVAARHAARLPDQAELLAQAAKVRVGEFRAPDQLLAAAVADAQADGPGAPLRHADGDGDAARPDRALLQVDILEQIEIVEPLPIPAELVDVVVVALFGLHRPHKDPALGAVIAGDSDFGDARDQDGDIQHPRRVGVEADIVDDRRIALRPVEVLNIYDIAAELHDIVDRAGLDMDEFLYLFGLDGAGAADADAADGIVLIHLDNDLAEAVAGIVLLHADAHGVLFG